MAQFYTHVLIGTKYALDPEGHEFPDLEAACESARNGARRLISDEILAGRDPVQLEYHICEEAGTRLATLAIGATVTGLD
jgi:hypothetical protein